MAIIARMEPDGRLRLPDAWSDEFPPDQEVELVRSDEGVLVKAVRRMSIQAALKRKLPMNRPSHLDLADLDMDSLG